MSIKRDALFEADGTIWVGSEVLGSETDEKKGLQEKLKAKSRLYTGLFSNKEFFAWRHEAPAAAAFFYLFWSVC